MANAKGTQGYEKVVPEFISSSQALDFFAVNEVIVDFLPSTPARILDAGSGAGQNAAAMAQLGHQVIAVEPLDAFRNAAVDAYPDFQIRWIADSLPDLNTLGLTPAQFDFVLVSAVWHHLDESECERALARIADLLESGGYCAMSLRHGPAGAGTHVFPTDGQETIEQAHKFGMERALLLQDQPSVLPNKKMVTWTWLVLKKS